jgi:hypothetical protein
MIIIVKVKVIANLSSYIQYFKATAVAKETTIAE